MIVVIQTCGGKNIAKNVALIACQNVMPKCFGCSPCITGLKAQGDTVVSLVPCGGPPGNGIVAMLNSINLWFKAHNPGILPITPVYGKCVKQCGQCKPKMDELAKPALPAAIQGKEDIIDTYQHPYSPKGLFEKV